MNSKGSFTAIIGVSLVLLIAAIGFTYYSSGASQKALLEQQDALEVRQHWSNVRYLLDKAAAEALYDSSDSACTATDYSPKLRTYFTKVLQNSNSVINCEIPGLSTLATATNEVAFSFSLKCSKSNSISYKNQVVLGKRLQAVAGPPASCQVWDLQGNSQDI